MNIRLPPKCRPYVTTAGCLALALSIAMGEAALAEEGSDVVSVRIGVK